MASAHMGPFSGSCNQCPKTYKLATAKSSTQPLWYHLKTKHGVLPKTRKKLLIMAGTAHDCLPDYHALSSHVIKLN